MTTTPNAFVFPGQGSYLPGVLTHLRDEAGGLKRTLDTIDSIVVEHGHSPVSPLVFDAGSPAFDRLLADDPDRLQLAVFATSIGMAALLDEAYGFRPDIVLGHSFGNIAALAVAGVLGLEDATRVVCERLAALRKADLPDSGLLAVELGFEQTKELLASIGDPSLVAAIENAPQQSVISGPTPNLEAVRRRAGDLGVRVTPIGAPHAFHHPLLAPAADDLADRLRGIEPATPKTKVYSSSLDRYLQPSDDVMDLLRTDLIRPQRFMTSLKELYSKGVGTFVECGARAVLSRLVTESLPSATVIAPLSQRVTRAHLDELLEPLASGTAQTGPDGEVPSGDRLVAELVTLYADVLEYPEDVVTVDAELEADLGVDSLTQSTLVEQAIDRYGLANPDVRPTEYPTIGAIAELIESLAKSDRPTDG